MSNVLCVMCPLLTDGGALCDLNMMALSLVVYETGNDLFWRDCDRQPTDQPPKQNIVRIVRFKSKDGLKDWQYDVTSTIYSLVSVYALPLLIYIIQS